MKLTSGGLFIYPVDEVSMLRKYGYVHRPLSPGEWVFNPQRIGAASVNRTGEPNLLNYRRSNLRQLSANSCVAFAATRAFDVACGMTVDLHLPQYRGVKVEYLSPQRLYFDARKWPLRHLSIEDQNLSDDGCYPQDLYEAMANNGVTSWESAPYSPTTVNKMPPVESYLDSFIHRNIEYRQIMKGNAVEDIRSSLCHGCPVTFGMKVDQRFEDFRSSNDSEIIVGIDWKNAVGSHMMTILADRPDLEAFVVDNWWQDWGLADYEGFNGMCLMSYSLFQGPYSDSTLSMFSLNVPRNFVVEWVIK